MVRDAGVKSECRRYRHGTASLSFSLAVPQRENQNPVAVNMHQGARPLNAELPAPPVIVAPHRALLNSQLLGHHQRVFSSFEVRNDLLVQGVDASPRLEGFRKLDSQLFSPFAFLIFGRARGLFRDCPLLVMAHLDKFEPSVIELQH